MTAQGLDNYGSEAIYIVGASVGLKQVLQQLELDLLHTSSYTHNL